MMKKIVLACIVLNAFNYTGFSQNWCPLGIGLDGEVHCFYPDTSRNILWVGGWFWEASNIKAITIANWDSIKWDTLPNLLPGNATNAIINYDSSLFVGGYNGCFIFKNNQWVINPLYNGYSLFGGYVTGFAVFNNMLYVIGAFDHVKGITAHSVARFDGLNWQSVNNFPKYNAGNQFNIVSSIKFYKGRLFIAGQFADSLSNGYPVFASYLDSSGWHTIGGLLHGSLVNINAMSIYKNNLYFAGSFLKSNGNLGDNIVMFDGTNFHEVGNGLQGGPVYDLIVYNNNLIACGQFKYAGNIFTKYIAKWDGSKWCSFGSDFDRPVIKLGVFRNQLYIGCGFTIDGDSVNYIAKWLGGDYVDTCSQTYSVTDISDNTGVAVFPNPAHSQITIISNNGEPIKHAEIYSLTGKMVLQKELNAANAEIDVSGLDEGLYFIKVKTLNNLLIRKIVIMN